MRGTKRIRSSLKMIAFVGLAGASIGIVAWRADWLFQGNSRPLAERYQFAPVSRTVLGGSMIAMGTLESSKRTVIECELERLAIGVAGRRLAAGGASTLIEVVPDGSIVQEGDVLARLDSSDYEELLRQQQIAVERARADHRQSELDLEVAKLAINEYENGVMNETLKNHQRLIALAESELTRCKDRLDWTIRMSDKGYASMSQLVGEKQNHARALFNMEQQTGARRLFERYTAPRRLQELRKVEIARESTLNYRANQLRMSLERLEKLQIQVERCTIRAPHDGFVIYANDSRRNVVIETGISVHQKQKLFYLPDLDQMEVVAMLHESVVDKVSKGMSAQVTLEGAPGVAMTGTVASIGSLPVSQWWSDVRYFEGVVRLDGLNRKGLLPGMTAHVKFLFAPKADVLAVPIEAVAREDGHDVCYVAHEDGLERRRVSLGEATHDLLEVAGGLEEGERVVLNPRRDQVILDMNDAYTLAAPEADPGQPSEAESADTVAALH